MASSRFKDKHPSLDEKWRMDSEYISSEPNPFDFNDFEDYYEAICEWVPAYRNDDDRRMHRHNWSLVHNGGKER